ncbi:MAG: ADP-ribosylglycohydrolase family protein, partial [Planctomycetota bacterium]
ESLRPRPAAYGPWLAKAPAGTTTDDTRHKVVLMRALESLRSKGQKLTSIDSQGLAQAYLDYEVAGEDEIRNQLKKHVEEGFREYRYAARWILGQREPSVAKPVERLWAGIDNCSGQMMLPPLACMYPGKPGEAYRKAFQIDFIDAPGARDMAAAWLAGLAAVLGEKETDPARQRWSVLWDAMRSTDPFEFSKTPFAGRPLHRWMDLAMDVAERANGRPWRLFELLETDGRPLYWWDAHYTLLVPISILVFCQYKPLAAMRLTMDFGHDSDSYLQTLGCMVGAVYGEGIFDKAMRSAIDADMARQYGASIESWMAVFSGA